MRTVFRTFFRLLIGSFCLSLLYLIACKWILPPLTLTQLADRLQGKTVRYQPVSYENMAPDMKLAVLAAEDQLFPVHKGFDWRAVRESLNGERGGKKGNRPVGAAASTISQQTAKNVFLWQGKGSSRYVRKVLEIPYTWLIENIWGKQRILEVYLNVAQMGDGIYGVEAAAGVYFRKTAAQLSRAEAAHIAAALPNPVIYTVKPVSAYVRRKSAWVQKQMANLRGYEKIRELIDPKKPTNLSNKTHGNQ